MNSSNANITTNSTAHNRTQPKDAQTMQVKLTEGGIAAAIRAAIEANCTTKAEIEKALGVLQDAACALGIEADEMQNSRTEERARRLLSLAEAIETGLNEAQDPGPKTDPAPSSAEAAGFLPGVVLLNFITQAELALRAEYEQRLVAYNEAEETKRIREAEAQSEAAANNGAEPAHVSTLGSEVRRHVELLAISNTSSEGAKRRRVPQDILEAARDAIEAASTKMADSPSYTHKRIAGEMLKRVADLGIEAGFSEEEMHAALGTEYTKNCYFCGCALTSKLDDGRLRTCSDCDVDAV